MGINEIIKVKIWTPELGRCTLFKFEKTGNVDNNGNVEFIELETGKQTCCPEMMIWEEERKLSKENWSSKLWFEINGTRYVKAGPFDPPTSIDKIIFGYKCKVSE